MPNSFADIPGQFKAIFSSMSSGKIITLFILVAGTIAGLVVLISWSGQPEFMPLYSRLSAEDAGEVVAKLREQKIPYRLSQNGTTVQIPSERIYEVRLDLASQGLPRGSGVGFEVFDNAKLGMTEFVQNINYQRALQGELSRTINGLSEVESSRVHIVMSPRSLFIENEEPASASVILNLHPGRWLAEDQIQGIVHLVSSSVPRLTPDHITIVDQDGKLLAGLKDQPSITKLSADHLDFQQRKERAIEKRVITMLEKVLGKDKAIVRVACDLDFIQHEKTEEKYFPDNQVVRSEQLLNEVSKQKESSPMGIPGLASNITQGHPTQTQTAATPEYQKEDKTRNYEIGKMTSREVMPVGKLQRLSVAVVVDGIYKTITVGKGDKRHEERKYEARSPEEMSKLENIVKRAVNFDESRGDKVEVANIPFETEKLIEPPPVEGLSRLFDQLKAHSSIFKFIAAGLFIAFTFIFVLRPLIRWLTDTPWEDVDLLEHLPKTIAEIEKQYAQGGQQSNYVNQAAQVIAANQEDSSRLMQQWLKES